METIFDALKHAFHFQQTINWFNLHAAFIYKYSFFFARPLIFGGLTCGGCGYIVVLQFAGIYMLLQSRCSQTQKQQTNTANEEEKKHTPQISFIHVFHLFLLLKFVKCVFCIYSIFGSIESLTFIFHTETFSYYLFWSDDFVIVFIYNWLAAFFSIVHSPNHYELTVIIQLFTSSFSVSLDGILFHLWFFFVYF